MTSAGKKPNPNALRQRRYRERHIRIDYTPDPDAMDIILQHFGAGGLSLSGTIDELIRAGDEAVSGDAAKVSSETR